VLATSGTSVSEVAARWHFADSGHFRRTSRSSTASPRPPTPPQPGAVGKDVSFGSEDYVGQAGDLVEVVGSGAQDQFVGAQGLELLDGVAQ